MVFMGKTSNTRQGSRAKHRIGTHLVHCTNAMKFQSDLFETAITGYGPGWITVRGERITHSVLLHSSGERSAWPCTRFEDLDSQHFEPLALQRPELVLFGSGARLRFRSQPGSAR
jgi:uncharacterized protein